MKGKRVGARRAQGRYLAKRAHARQKGAKKKDAKLRRMICGAVLALLVAAGVLFPQRVAELARSAAALIGRDADFRGALAAFGRAVSGEEEISDSLQDAYTAVFNPSQTDAEDSADEEAARLNAAPLPDDGEQVESEQSVENGEETVLSGGYMMAQLPENASLEQRHLGFAYTSPVNGKLTSAFGWREHPSDGATRFHYGIDLAAQSGTEIRAFADGTVFAVGESSTLGKYIILHHAGGYRTLYAHCSAVLVSSGTVCMGDVIARVGESGTATGAHLHFELQDGALYLNPIYYVAIG